MKRRNFFGIQLLRGFAALMVVSYHVAANLSGDSSTGSAPVDGFRTLPELLWGNAGVDLFFVISGFVMIWTTQDDWWRPLAWRSFLRKRLSRIFPLYWLLTTGKIILVLGAPYLFRDTHLRLWHTIASYLLIPAWDAAGRINPIITAGWTLCFEMAFYYVCTLSLALRRPPILIATPLFVTLGLVGIFRTPQWGALASLIDPLLLEFVAGMWVAELARRGLVRGHPLAMGALVLMGLTLWLASESLSAPTEYALRALVWGGPSVILLYAVVALEPQVRFQRLWPLLILGDASYSIYLTHVLILPPIISRVRGIRLSGLGEIIVYILIVAVGIAGGVVVWWMVERKVIRGLINAITPRREAWTDGR